MRPPADESAIETPIGLLILILVVATLTFFGVRYEMKIQAHKKREAAYQASLSSYTQVFRPGMTRKEVEDYLHKKNVEFRQMCCVDAMELSKHHSWDDLIKIGREDAPWFCGEHNVYLAFQFIDQGKHGPWWDANDLDTLKVISVYHWLEGCL
jgi:hypothetical protein